MEVTVDKPELQIHQNMGDKFMINQGHNIHKVTLWSSEEWALDVSGQQFGFSNPICPWNAYLRDRVEAKEIKLRGPIGYCRDEFLKYSINQLEKHDLAKLIDAKIDTWIQKQGGQLNSMMQNKSSLTTSMSMSECL